MKMIALLRGINVGGNRLIPMKELCKLAERIGFTEVAHYIQSGNLVFEAAKVSAQSATDKLEKAIEKKFGFPVDVMVRTAPQWKKYASGSPFPDAEKDRPNILYLGISKDPCAKDAASKLKERATQGEQIKLQGDALWVDFITGAGKSKLTPVLFEKAAGSPVTLRNWNTVLKINEMLGN